MSYYWSDVHNMFSAKTKHAVPVWVVLIIFICDLCFSLIIILLVWKMRLDNISLYWWSSLPTIHHVEWLWMPCVGLVVRTLGIKCLTNLHTCLWPIRWNAWANMKYKSLIIILFFICSGFYGKEVPNWLLIFPSLFYFHLFL